MENTHTERGEERKKQATIRKNKTPPSSAVIPHRHMAWMVLYMKWIGRARVE